VLVANVEEFEDAVAVFIEVGALVTEDTIVLAVIKELLLEVVVILYDCGAKYPLQVPWTHVLVAH
jgi:hypothetical protein